MSSLSTHCLNFYFREQNGCVHTAVIVMFHVQLVWYHPNISYFIFIYSLESSIPKKTRDVKLHESFVDIKQQLDEITGIKYAYCFMMF